MGIRQLTARRAWIWTHRTLGFAFGIFFLILGLTGTLLVYRGQVDAFFDPAPYRAMGGAETVGADRAAAIARRTVSDGRLLELTFPRPHAGPDGAVYVAYLREAHHTTLVYVDPHDGRVLAQRPISASVSRWVHDVHEEFLLGRIGKTLVALVGLGLFVTTLVGVVLWPGWRNLRSGFSFKRAASTWRLNYDLHKILGIAGTIFLLFFSATGVILTYKAATRAVIAAKLPPPPRVPAHDPAAPTLPVSALVTSALAAFPGSVVRSVSLPAVASHPAAVDLIGADDVDQIDGDKRVYLDPVTAQVLGRLDSMAHRYGFTDLVYALHAGRLWASGGALAVAAILGLLPAALLLTGFFMWLLRREGPRRSARGSRSRETPQPSDLSPV